ncbi:MAG TPA: TIGR03619 family F420-dependent LLM class oxidoreductase [Acetobacteraceae bacterium]|nr:TIGR03619 family F420-dependent LLM class oxidoreductase [Acetobacteraceae bacterium]
MDVGIHIGTRGCLASRANLVACAQRAEALGYAHIGIPDRLVLPRNVGTRYPYTEDGVWVGAATGDCLDVLGALCFLAACTERIRLLPSVLVVPYRPAVVAAKMLTTVDVLSAGRLIAGVGVGWMEEEFEPLGAPPFKTRGAVTDAYLAKFRALWTEDAADVIFSPKPVQARVPIWVGGESPAALRRTVRFGDGWYPASHNHAALFDTPARLATGIDQLAHTAEQHNRDPATIQVAYLWFKPIHWAAQRTTDGARQLFTGSAADMQEDAAALARAGVQHVIVLPQAPTITETLERLQRFAEDVIHPLRR